MDNLLENAINGKYEGSPKKYVALYNDFLDAGIDYNFLASFQCALFNGRLVECINQYMIDNWVRP